MLALASDEIVMGTHSQLGPIDPQFTLPTPEGPRNAPGQAILDQFEQAKDECKDTTRLPAWLPILRMYGPGLIANITHQHDLAQELVAGWTDRYLLPKGRGRRAQGREIAKWLADFKTFKSHARPLHRDVLRQHGVPVTDLEEDQTFQDLVLSVHHATQLTLGQTPAVKVVENHQGRAWIQMGQLFGMPMPVAAPPARSPSPPPTPG